LFSSEIEITKSFSKMEISTEKKIEKFKNLIGDNWQEYEILRKKKKDLYVRKY
jgi:hypothetical protein